MKARTAADVEKGASLEIAIDEPPKTLFGLGDLRIGNLFRVASPILAERKMGVRAQEIGRLIHAFGFEVSVERLCGRSTAQVSRLCRESLYFDTG